METSNNLIFNEFLLDFEKKYDVNLFFVCETASRSHNIFTEDSDFDLAGFYIPNPKDSLNIIPKIANEYKITHNKLIIEGKEYDVDISFFDFRYFARKKCLNSETHYDYFFFSPVIYINKYPEIIDKIKRDIIPNQETFLAKMKYLFIYCEKSLTKDYECLNKKLLTSIVHGIQYLHVCFFGTFPEYNIFKVIDKIRKALNEDDNLLKSFNLTLEHKNCILQAFELVDYFYDLKVKQGRKSVSSVIPAAQIKFKNFLENEIKYDKELIKDVNLREKMDLNYFEEILIKILKASERFSKIF